MSKNIKLLMKFMKGARLQYSGAVAAQGTAVFFSLSIPFAIRYTIDTVIGGKESEMPEFLDGYAISSGAVKSAALCAAVIVLLSFARGLFLFYKGKWAAVASESTAKRMKERLYDHIQKLPFNYHVKAETGDLVQRCTSDVETIRQFMSVQLVEIGRAVFMVALSLTVMFSVNVKLALASVSLLPVIFLYALFFFRRVQTVFRKSDEAEGRLSTVLQENVTGVRVVRAFARSDFESDRFEESNIEFRNQSHRLMKLLAWYWSVSDFLCMVQTVFVLMFGVYLAVGGQITLGTLVLFTSYEAMLLWPIRQMGRILSDMGKALVAAHRISEILDEKTETTGDGKCPEIEGALEFKNVSFGYREGEKVLDKLSFEVKKGETVAILGPTGSGKSSLMHLLPRLYDYDDGSITVDGVELRNIDRKWIRKNVGIVLQEPFLYSRNIAENLSIGKCDVEETEIFEAARTASLHDVVSEFEKGYETMVGEQGVTLSGGQRQRLAIARTLLLETPILIFDDSLSAVDTETDAAIRRALKKRSSEATTFIVSHRITTLMEADRILVLEGGRIVEEGKHHELVARKGLYRRVWETQCGSDNLEMVAI